MIGASTGPPHPRPRHAEIDWRAPSRPTSSTTSPSYRTVVPETRCRLRPPDDPVEREIILCIDQTGSMAASVVYSSVFGAVLASLRAVSTRLVVFDTAVVDLTDELDDPVDVLFGVQLGGGTDINQAPWPTARASSSALATPSSC